MVPAITGVYISRTSYVRPGERSLDGLYKAYHTVVYYRYLRFFPDGEHSDMSFPVAKVSSLLNCTLLHRLSDVSDISPGAWLDCGEALSQA